MEPRPSQELVVSQLSPSVALNRAMSASLSVSDEVCAGDRGTNFGLGVGVGRGVAVGSDRGVGVGTVVGAGVAVGACVGAGVGSGGAAVGVGAGVGAGGVAVGNEFEGVNGTLTISRSSKMSLAGSAYRNIPITNSHS